MPASRLTIIGSGEGSPYPAIPNLACKVSSEETGNAFTVLEFRLGPGSGAGLHTHKHEDEIVLVREGACTVGTVEREWLAETGTVVVFHKGTPHLFRNAGSGPCTLLITAVPGGLDRYFAAVSQALERQQPERIPGINETFGISFAP